MKKSLFCWTCILFLIVALGCKSDVKTPENGVNSQKILILTESETDALGIFAVGSEKTWNSECPLVVQAKKVSGTCNNLENNFKYCLQDGYWVRNDSVMAPATYHFDIVEESSLFRMQIQCLKEENQGLCCVKFTSRWLTGSGRDNYKGTYEVRIGLCSNRVSNVGADDAIDTVLYSTLIEIR